MQKISLISCIFYQKKTNSKTPVEKISKKILSFNYLITYYYRFNNNTIKTNSNRLKIKISIINLKIPS